jgi:hypothetical protein
MSKSETDGRIYPATNPDVLKDIEDLKHEVAELKARIGQMNIRRLAQAQDQ